MNLWRKLFGRQQVAEFLAPLTHEEKVAVSNALPELSERVIADKRLGIASAGNANLTESKFDVPAFLWKLDIPDLERLVAAMRAGMRVEAAASVSFSREKPAKPSNGSSAASRSTRTTKKRVATVTPSHPIYN